MKNKTLRCHRALSFNRFIIIRYTPTQSISEIYINDIIYFCVFIKITKLYQILSYCLCQAVIHLGLSAAFAKRFFLARADSNVISVCTQRAPLSVSFVKLYSPTNRIWQGISNKFITRWGFLVPLVTKNCPNVHCRNMLWLNMRRRSLMSDSLVIAFVSALT